MILVFFAHSARPRPRMSGSPGAAAGNTTRGGDATTGTVSLAFRRKNILTPTPPGSPRRMSPHYGCYAVKLTQLSARGDALLTTTAPNRRGECQRAGRIRPMGGADHERGRR